MTQAPTQARLLGGSAKSAKFEAFGDTVEGYVVGEPEVRHVTKMGTGEIDTFPSGDPKWQIVATLQTTLREDADDDGQRTVYIKSFMLKPGLSNAIAAAGAEQLEPGGYLKITYTHNGEAQRGGNAPKMYAVEYRRPNPQQAVLNGGQQQPQGQSYWQGGVQPNHPSQYQPYQQPVQDSLPPQGGYQGPATPQAQQGYAAAQQVPQAPQQPDAATIAAMRAIPMTDDAIRQVYPHWTG